MIERVEKPEAGKQGDRGGDLEVLGLCSARCDLKEIKRRDFLAGLSGSFGAVAILPACVTRTIANATHPMWSDIQVIATMSDLRQVERPQFNGIKTVSPQTLIWLAGYRTSLDGGEGHFWWDATSTSTDDGGLAIQCTTTDSGRWIRLHSPNFISVKWFGAAGDGIQDDREAFERWCDAIMRNMSTEPLHGLVPPGIYRIGRRTAPRYMDQFAKEGAITLNGASNVTIEFLHATMLIDNLDHRGQGDQFHGIVVRGPASNITLINPRVEWKIKPTSRSQGDAIRFYGYPDDMKRAANGVGLISGVNILDSTVKWAPQAGLLMCGCSDVYISRHESVETLADGFHLNACRRVTCDSIVGDQTGDDVCALVTYYGDLQNARLYSENNDDPYVRTDLGPWSNSATRIGQVTAVNKGGANGVRFAGAHDVQINKVTVDGKGKGIVVDCGLAGGSWHWSNLASTGCWIGQLVATACAVGLHVETYNIADADRGSVPWQFDVTVDNIQASRCRDFGIYLDCEGVAIGHAHLYKNSFLASKVRNVSIDMLTMDGDGLASCSCLIVGGTAGTEFSKVRLDTKLSINTAEIHNMRGIEFQDITGFTFDSIKVNNSVGNAVIFTRCKEISGKCIAVTNPISTHGSFSLGLIPVQKFTLAKYVFRNRGRYDGILLEVGGGTATGGISTDIHIERIVLAAIASSVTPKIVIQEGPYRPAGLTYNLTQVEHD